MGFVIGRLNSSASLYRLAPCLSKVPEMVLKPFAKKALESGISHAGDKLGKKAAEKSGELIMRKLHGSTKQSVKPTKPTKPKQEDYNTILNRLISGTGY